MLAILLRPWLRSPPPISRWTADDVAAGRTVHLLTDADFNGERLFQAAKFGTETQYQHPVRVNSPARWSRPSTWANDTNIHLDPAITSEFANAVYRFGHSMLDEVDPGSERKPRRLADGRCAGESRLHPGRADPAPSPIRSTS